MANIALSIREHVQQSPSVRSPPNASKNSNRFPSDFNLSSQPYTPFKTAYRPPHRAHSHSHGNSSQTQHRHNTTSPSLQPHPELNLYLASLQPTHDQFPTNQYIESHRVPIADHEDNHFDFVLLATTKNARPGMKYIDCDSDSSPRDSNKNMCRYGSSCTRMDCHFDHPNMWVLKLWPGPVRWKRGGWERENIFFLPLSISLVFIFNHFCSPCLASHFWQHRTPPTPSFLSITHHTQRWKKTLLSLCVVCFLERSLSLSSLGLQTTHPVFHFSLFLFTDISSSFFASLSAPLVCATVLASSSIWEATTLYTLPALLSVRRFLLSCLSLSLPLPFLKEVSWRFTVYYLPFHHHHSIKKKRNPLTSYYLSHHISLSLFIFLLLSLFLLLCFYLVFSPVERRCLLSSLSLSLLAWDFCVFFCPKFTLCIPFILRHYLCFLACPPPALSKTPFCGSQPLGEESLFSLSLSLSLSFFVFQIKVFPNG